MFLPVAVCSCSRRETFKEDESCFWKTGMVPLNSPGGSTLHWFTERGLLCPAALVEIRVDNRMILCIIAHVTPTPPRQQRNSLVAGVAIGK